MLLIQALTHPCPPWGLGMAGWSERRGNRVWEAGLGLDRMDEQRAGEPSGDPSLLHVG